MNCNSQSSSTKYGFFEDAKGNKSSTRLKTFLAAITAMLIAISSVYFQVVTITESLPIIITLLAFSSGEKSYQSFLESKSKTFNHE
ncbi:MAG: hypothetical protein KKF98_08030 [Bacteroidetes bacterium]|nr:hypothetical protein [Bacteroidota bacterium]